MYFSWFLETDVWTYILNYKVASLLKKLILPDLRKDYHLWRGETVIVLCHSASIKSQLKSQQNYFALLHYFYILGSEKEHKLLAKK